MIAHSILKELYFWFAGILKRSVTWTLEIWWWPWWRPLLSDQPYVWSGIINSFSFHRFIPHRMRFEESATCSTFAILTFSAVGIHSKRYPNLFSFLSSHIIPPNYLQNVFPRSSLAEPSTTSDKNHFTDCLATKQQLPFTVENFHFSTTCSLALLPTIPRRRSRKYPPAPPFNITNTSLSSQLSTAS